MVASETTRHQTTVVRERYDWTAIPPASAVVEAVSRALDCDPTSFGPLYEYVDPDALNTIIAPDGPADAVGSAVVSFRFDAHEVTVHRNGDVVVRPHAEAES
jgi:hypothetical protein